MTDKPHAPSVDEDTALSSVSDGAGSRYTSVHSQRVEGFHPYADGMGGFFLSSVTRSQVAGIVSCYIGSQVAAKPGHK